MGFKIDISGQKFSRLTAIKPIGYTKAHKTIWLCQCDCGNTFEVVLGDLRNGKVKSCGCYNQEVRSKRLKEYRQEHGTTHGMSDTPIYQSWADMKTRCNNHNNHAYRHYGGRGIAYCDRWETFEGFYEDMGSSYFKGGTIERVDVNGNYSKENCTWITIAEQHKNTRLTHKVVADGD